MTTTTMAAEAALDDGRLQRRWRQEAPSNNQPRDVVVVDDKFGSQRGLWTMRASVDGGDDGDGGRR